MLTMPQIDDTNILEITVNDGISAQDIDQAATKIDAIITTHGSVRLLEIIKNLGKVELAALWKDLKFAPDYLSQLSHVAVVVEHT
ncbi:MAG: STAS/SEC14 domain-containing protein [Methylophilaceae bacterium]